MIFALLLLLLGSFSWAGTGTSGANFLDIPVGAEPAALGSAYTARAETAYATLWNPAALARLQTPEVSAMHLSYLDSISYDHLGVAVPVMFGDEKTGFGVAMQSLGSGQIERRLIDGTASGSFSTKSSAYTFGVGQALGSELALGGSLKEITEKIDSASGSAFAADLGALYYPTKRWSLGATLQNIGSRLKLVSQANPLPLQGHLGVAWRAGTDWMISTEAVYRRDGPGSGHFGVEWSPATAYVIRTGYQTSHTKELGFVSGLTAGLALRFWGQEIAYAWVPFGELGNTHYFSLELRWSTVPREDRTYPTLPRRRERVEKGDEFEDTPSSHYSDYRNVYDILSDDERKSLKHTDKD